MVDPRVADAQPARTASLSAFSPEVARRIALTVSCTDSDAIPKVPGAGEFTTVGGTPVQVMHNGVLVEKDGYYGAWQTEIIRRLRGHHEPQEEAVFQKLLERIAATEERPAMIELGSYWAYYSLWFRKVCPRSTVIALEPDPAFLDVGRRNFALNDEDGVFVHGLIGPATGATASFQALSDGQIYEVPLHDLESLMSIGGVDRVSLVLADIQGAEAALVESSQSVLAAGRVRFLVISTHHHSLSNCATTHQDLLARLEALGAHIIAEHSVGESFSGDGLIAAAFDAQDADITVPISYARQRDSLFGELEPDLADAWDRLRAAQAERDDARAALAAAQERQQELDRILASRTWRWSAAPRSLYRRLRQTL